LVKITRKILERIIKEETRKVLFERDEYQAAALQGDAAKIAKFAKGDGNRLGFQQAFRPDDWGPEGEQKGMSDANNISGGPTEGWPTREALESHDRAGELKALFQAYLGLGSIALVGPFAFTPAAAEYSSGGRAGMGGKDLPISAAQVGSDMDLTGNSLPGDPEEVAIQNRAIQIQKKIIQLWGDHPYDDGGQRVNIPAEWQKFMQRLPGMVKRLKTRGY
jgi:hypothetical protein